MKRRRSRLLQPRPTQGRVRRENQDLLLVLAGDVVLARNDQEMVAFKLSTEGR